VESLHALKVRQMLVSAGAEAVGNTPDELSRFLQSEMAKWARVVKAADIKAE
jgi:tripartite-type tricarboxylate transporter receptor subunit TctC